MSYLLLISEWSTSRWEHISGKWKIHSLRYGGENVVISPEQRGWQQVQETNLLSVCACVMSVLRVVRSRLVGHVTHFHPLREWTRRTSGSFEQFWMFKTVKLLIYVFTWTWIFFQIVIKLKCQVERNLPKSKVHDTGTCWENFIWKMLEPFWVVCLYLESRSIYFCDILVPWGSHWVSHRKC